MTYLLHNIGPSPSSAHHIASNYNTREEIEALPQDALLTFDGVYTSVFDNRDLLEGRNVILFVTGNYIGKNNSFDLDMPLETFCSQQQLEELENMGCQIGWHTWSHPDLTRLSEEDVEKELTHPFHPFETDLLAYPYGRFNESVVRIAQKLGYKRAWSVTQGDGSPLKLKRNYL